MTGRLIKSDAAPEQFAVRPYEVPEPVQKIAVVRLDEERERLVRRVIALEAELVERNLALGDIRLQAAKDVEKARAEGHRTGFSEAEDQQAARTLALEQSLLRAEMELRESLVAMERLAARLAEECLDVMVGEHKSRAEWLRQLLQHQLAKIDKAMLLRVIVSPEDFPDVAALQQLAEIIKLPVSIVASDGDMLSGDCVMKTCLGRLEVGLNQQWGALRGVLDELVQPEVTP